MRLCAAAITAAMCISLFSCAGPAPTTDQTDQSTPLIVGYGSFEGTFNPFYASSAEDTDVCTMTGVNLLESDGGGSIVLASDEEYNGIADCEIVKNSDGTVSYNITIRDDVKFSDGEALGVDDVLFSMYVLSDPTYDGPSTFSSLPIVGMDSYRSGMLPLADIIRNAGEYNSDFSHFTKAEQDLYWETLKGEAGIAFVKEIVDYCINGGYAANVTEAIDAWGYGERIEEGKEYTEADFFAILCEAHDNRYEDFAEKDSAGTSLFEFTKQILCKTKPEYGNGVVYAESEPNISGIVKTGDNSICITMERYDASAIYSLAIGVAPMHYYGSAELYDEQANTFGFKKGDLSAIREKNSAPMGAGPYKFVAFEKGVVSFAANDVYYKGKPNIAEVQFKQHTDGAELVNAIAEGTLDICVPSLSSDVVDKIKEVNGNSELTGPVITYSPVDFNGYGYIGINAKNVNVADNAGSKASKNMRKAFATLFAVYRTEHIAAYYGELAQVIEYPISSTSWAAPTPTDTGYAPCYSYDVNGRSIYTENMTEQERYAAALEAAKGYFVAAGYSFDEDSGKFTSAPRGAKLAYTMIIPGEGKADHPVYGIASKVSEALATVGITLNLEDPVDTDKLWSALNAGTAEMWCAAWSGTLDPDLYRVYYSGNYPTNTTGTGKNNFYLQDQTLDAKILKARQSEDVAYRKSMYLECLNSILDWGVEIPVYQRQQAYLFSTERLNIASLPENMTPYRTWLSGIEKLEMK